MKIYKIPKFYCNVNYETIISYENDNGYISLVKQFDTYFITYGLLDDINTHSTIPCITATARVQKEKMSLRRFNEIAKNLEITKIVNNGK